MDILKDFKDFFYDGGLNALIHQFRNPTEVEELAFDTKYIPVTDVRESYNAELEDTCFKSKTVSPFSGWLNHNFEKLKKELKNRCENLILTQKDDKEGFVQITVSESDMDFGELRSKILNDENLKKYHQELLLFVGDVEGLYKKSRHELMQKDDIKGKQKIKSMSNVQLSFGFKSKNKMLEKLYSELVRNDFIDEDKTSKKVFIELLTANNIYNVSGEVFFKCQTRQATYIISHLIKLSSNPEIQFFGDSGKFKSKKDIPLSANNISKSNSSSNPNPLLLKDEIDRIFSNLNSGE